jgi:hypothetical protein
MSLVADVQSYLAALDIIDGSSEWPSVRRHAHDDTARLVVLTEDGGGEPETPSPTGIGDSAMMEPAVQVLVRGDPQDSDAAEAKAAEIFVALHGLLQTEVGTMTYARIKAQTPGPLFIGFDESGRPEFTISFRAVRPVTVS